MSCVNPTTIVSWIALLILPSLQTPAKDVPGAVITERIGKQVPLDAMFNSENGDSTSLGNLLTRPTILSLVFYRCPGICTPLLNSMVNTLNRMELQPGRDYRLVTISINELEDAELAAEKKRSYLPLLEKPLAEDDWRWVTGSALQIRRVTWALGYQFHAIGNNSFLHPAGIFVLSPDGKLIKCLHGMEYSPLALKLAIKEASGSLYARWASRFYELWVSYDHDQERYVLQWGRVLGSSLAGVLLLTAVVVAGVRRRS